MVSSEKKKNRFAKIFFFATISLHFRLFHEISLQSVSRKNAKFSQNRKCKNFAKKGENFAKKPKFSRKINETFAKKTHGLTKFSQIRIFFFAFLRETFRSLETLVTIKNRPTRFEVFWMHQELV